jgi:HD-GYP domain-containing protein (c-di-GMP phosphodiesterase class II)
MAMAAFVAAASLINMASTIPVHDLRVGMFVHLDLGWMQHPFALSSFRLQSTDQIETIRGLGLSQVRWDPAQSAVDKPPEAPPVAAPETPAEAAQRQRRATLVAHRQQTALLDRECHEAGQALRDATRCAMAEPARALTDAEALAGKLVDRLAVQGEICIRLVNSQAGDRAAAHGLNVAVMALLMGRAVQLDDEAMLELGLGALLHDMGKLELPDRLRHVDESFGPAEIQAYREHVAHGITLGRRMGLRTGALAVLGQHHEHVDGSGFPLRLAADRITLAARIVGIVDRYDNLCNPALLAHALTPHEAVSLLFTQHRERYDAALLSNFIRMVGVYPAGSVVQLTDERFALVMAVNSSRPLKPRVLVHDPKVPPDEALLLDLEQVPQLGIRRSLPASRLPPAALHYLAPRPRVAYFFEPAPPRPAGP